MPQSYAPEFKRRLSASTQRKDEPTKASLRNTAYPKPAFPSGVVNLAENAKQKPLKIQILQTKWSL